jgi:aspartate kinase
MVVMKFGGTSVAGAACIRRVAGIVRGQLEKRPVLVLSAMGDTTDHLLEAAGLAYREARVSIGAIEDLHLETIRGLGLGDAEGEVVPLLNELKSLLTGISQIRELSRRTKDYLLSFGERLAVRIVAA